MKNVEAQGVKRIDFKKNFILCEKPFDNEDKPRKYYFHDTMSVDYYEVYEDLEMLISKGRSYADVYNSQKKVHELLNQSKVADAAIENYNSMALVSEKLQKREHPALRMVALFSCKEDENRDKFDDVVMDKKIRDWRNEGFAMEDFFHLAFNLVEGFLESYKEVSQGLLKKPTSAKQSTGPAEKEKSGGQSS